MRVVDSDTVFTVAGDGGVGYGTGPGFTKINSIIAVI